MKRRDFIRAGSFGVAGVTVLPSHILGKKVGKVAPSDKVNLACIGIGNRGGAITKDLYETGLANIVAFCDVDMGAPHTQAILKQFPDVPRFQDFREMFDKMGKQIDAVSVGTPDFSHFPITMLAMSLGKHVYVEKPIARPFQEVEMMMKGAKKYNVATQMGNQGHSEANYFQFKAWKDAGVIKDVTNITAHMNSARRWHKFDPTMTSYPAAEPIPKTLDWDTWLTTAQHHDYQKDFVNGQWRCWYDFGMGALGDWGAHLIDTAHQFLDLGLPTDIEPLYLKDHNPFFFPMSTTLSFKFPKRGDMPPVEIKWYDGLDNQPPLPDNYGASIIDPNIPPPADGTKFTENLKPGKIIYSKDLIFKGGSHGSTLSMLPSDKAQEWQSKLPVVPESPSNHFANFLKGCKGEEKCRSSFDIGGPLSQVFTLGVLAQRLGTKLTFDRETKQITNNPLANFLLQGMAPRKGWEEFYELV